APISLITSNPPPPGIWISRNTMSGSCSVMARTACAPVWHSAITRIVGWRSSCCRRPRRAGGPASTMIARKTFMSSPPDPPSLRSGQALSVSERGNACRDADRHAHPSSRNRIQRECGGVAVERCEPFARIRQSHTGARWLSRALVGIERRVGDFDMQVAVATVHADAYGAAALTWRDAVLHGVFDERLNGKVRHVLAVGVCRDRQFHTQPVAEANLLDREVLLDEGQLAAERHELFATRIHHRAQQLAQLQDHRAGPLGVIAE